MLPPLPSIRVQADERQRQEQEEQAALRQAASAVADRQARLARLQAEFPPEPETGDNVVKLAVQLPKRERIARRFNVLTTVTSVTEADNTCWQVANPVSMVYDYVFLQDKVPLRACALGCWLTGAGRRLKASSGCSKTNRRRSWWRWLRP